MLIKQISHDSAVDSVLVEPQKQRPFQTGTEFRKHAEGGKTLGLITGSIGGGLLDFTVCGSSRDHQ